MAPGDDKVWTDADTGQPPKRQKLNSADDEQVNRRQTDGVDGSEKRLVCRYGSKCYRRNEAHLLEYRHRLHFAFVILCRAVEDAFVLMKQTGNFTKLPGSFNLEDGDGSVILEQAIILNAAGFQLQLGQVSPKPNESRSVASCSSKNSTTSTSSSVNVAGTSFKDGNLSSSSTLVKPPQESDRMAKLFEERRNYMKQKQEAMKRIKETITNTEKGDAVATTKSYESKARPECMADKWETSCPFNIFLTKVRDIPVEPEGVLSASFTDLFDPSLGEIKSLIHINYMVEASWLLDQTMKIGLDGKATRIIYGEDNDELEEGAKAFPWLKIFKVKSPIPFGHHHTKMSIVQYEDGSIRFIIYTANLIESDWDNRTQGIWISPKCPKLSSESPSSEGESPTKFRADIIQYLSTYPTQASATWAHSIKFVDCSSIRVYFVASAPITSASNLNGFQFGIKKMEKILRSHDLETEPDWSLVAQCSSIGTLGGSAEDWLISEFGAAMSGRDKHIFGNISLVYPSTKAVTGSFDGVLGGGCLPYSAMTHMKQKWLNRHFRQWKADCTGRTRAPPHIKSYSRWSVDQSKMAWFLLTSANLSKAAWGTVNKKGDRLNIRSWEVGILFIPEMFGSSKHFSVTQSSDGSSFKFPLFFDAPLVKYPEGDYPWFVETLKLAMSE